jgi:hypothetical protein
MIKDILETPEVVVVKDPLEAKKQNWNDKIIKTGCITFSNDGKITEFVLLKELLRLANERGIKTRRVQFHPCNLPAPSAACTFEIEWSDGETSVGSGDCWPENSDPAFGAYPYAMAESRAMARAIRFGLNISMCSWEEVSNKTMTNTSKDAKSPITDSQIKVIAKIADRKKVEIEELLKEGTRKVTKLEELTTGEASNFIQYLNNK